MRFRFPGRDDEARRNVRRVSIAKLISQAGSGAAWIALVAIVYDRTDGSGVWLAAAARSETTITARRSKRSPSAPTQGPATARTANEPTSAAASHTPDPSVRS